MVREGQCHLVTDEEYQTALERVKAGQGDTDDVNLIAAWNDRRGVNDEAIHHTAPNNAKVR